MLKGAWIWPLSASHFTAEERRGPSAATMAHGCQAFRFLPRWDIEPEPLARSNSKNNKLRVVHLPEKQLTPVLIVVPRGLLPKQLTLNLKEKEINQHRDN